MCEFLQDGLARPEDWNSVRAEPFSPQAARRWLAPVILLSCIFLYLQVFIPPSTPLLISGDQSIYLHHATRMLDGQLIYRDYDHFTLPGTDLLYMGLFRIFGVRAWIPQVMLIALGVSSIWIITFISNKVITGTAALLPGLLFVSVPFSAYLDATHHWYSTVATTAALAVLIEKRTPTRLMWAGILMGIATFFTQSVGLLTVGFAIFSLWEFRPDEQPMKLLIKKEASLVVAFLVTLTICIAYFVQAVGVKKFFYYTVVFVVKYYPADWFNTWRVYLSGRPRLHAWTTWVDLPAFVLIQLIVPFLYIPFLVSLTSKRGPKPSEQRKRLMLLSLTGLFLFLSVASAPAPSRLYAVSVPALVLLVWFLESRKIGRTGLWILWATVIVLAVIRPLVIQSRWKGILDLPIGRTAFIESVPYEKCKWISERTQPFDYFFNDQMIAFALRLRNVSRVPILRPTDYTRPEEVQDAIQALDKFQVRFVSWYRGLDYEKEAARHPESNHLGPLRLYLHEHYHIAQTFSNGDQIWERNP